MQREGIKVIIIITYRRKAQPASTPFSISEREEWADEPCSSMKAASAPRAIKSRRRFSTAITIAAGLMSAKKRILRRLPFSINWPAINMPLASAAASIKNLLHWKLFSFIRNVDYIFDVNIIIVTSGNTYHRRNASAPMKLSAAKW